MCHHEWAVSGHAQATALTPSLLAVSSIGVLREGPLHAAIKAMLASPGDRFEVPIGGFVIDLVRADGELVEVQTGSFSALARKLDALLDTHRFRIVYPAAGERRIVRVDRDGEITSVRRSPRRAAVVEVFDKLVAFPSLLTHPHLTIEVLLLREDHVRRGRPEQVGRRTRDPGEAACRRARPGRVPRARRYRESAAAASIGSVQHARAGGALGLQPSARPADGLLSEDDGDHRGGGEARPHAASPTAPRSRSRSRYSGTVG